MRISDWSSDVCSSDLARAFVTAVGKLVGFVALVGGVRARVDVIRSASGLRLRAERDGIAFSRVPVGFRSSIATVGRGRSGLRLSEPGPRSEEHTSELQ